MKSMFVVALVLFVAVAVTSAAQSRWSVGRMPLPVAGGKVVPMGRLGGTNELQLAIALPLRDEAGLTNLLRDLYTPGNPQFHQFLKPGEFAQRFGPSAADFGAVSNFVASNGLKVVRQ